jgi:acyl-coenzyme A synthetase/AMP-(fatty) acid ligase
MHRSVPYTDGMNFTDVLETHARLRPDHPALVDDGRIISYGELHDLVTNAAANLQQAGIGCGEIVAVTLEDSAEYLMLMLALARLGAVMLAIDGRLPMPEKREAVIQAKACALVLEHPAHAIAGLRILHLEAICRSATVEFIRPSIGLDHPLALVQSSGTTGTPKSFHWSHAAMQAQAIRHRQCFGWSEQDRYLTVVKMGFFWERELCFVLFSIGATIVVGRATTANDLVEQAAHHRITILALTPTHLSALLGLQAATPPLFPTLRTMVVGSAPLTHERRLAVRRQLTPNFYEQLGTNEAGLMVLGSPADQDIEPAAIGRIAAGVEAQIVDADGQPVAPGEVGLVGYRGPSFPTCYIDDAAATARGFRDGWFYPGDLAAIDERGYFHFKGRADDVVNCEGVKFYPVEVEKVLLAHPAIMEAAVVGAPDAVAGEVPVAFLVAPMRPAVSELERFCAQRIAAYKVPRWFVFVAELPKNRTGKVLKRQLKEAYRELRARQMAGV